MGGLALIGVFADALDNKDKITSAPKAKSDCYPTQGQKILDAKRSYQINGKDTTVVYTLTADELKKLGVANHFDIK